VAIITGAGRGFCSGADVVTQAVGNMAGADVREQFIEPIGSFIQGIYNFEKPLIAAVNGVAVGAGLSIALAADIRIAAASARFITAWVDRGLLPDAGGSFFLPRTVGLSWAAEMTFASEPIDAATAERIGLVSRVVPDGQALATAKALAAKIAEKPPIALIHAKRNLRLGMQAPLEQQLLFESAGYKAVGQTEDFLEAVASFREKRKPSYKGR
jgi:2-(1,2-epoxy-1,2-dihydrophenyl)acetyl-CoA isomerase